jgi:nucleoside-diphosphate-sugar epimerase
MMSILRARENCGSPYHESKWAAEELIRNCRLVTILKSGMVCGRGDHMLFI